MHKYKDVGERPLLVRIPDTSRTSRKVKKVPIAEEVQGRATDHNRI
jgi:hypothetical protein